MTQFQMENASHILRIQNVPGTQNEDLLEVTPDLLSDWANCEKDVIKWNIDAAKRTSSVFIF